MLSASSWNANVCCLLYKHHRPHHPNHHPYRQGSTSCAILSSQMGEHGVGWENIEYIENMENMEKMVNINPMTKNTRKNHNMRIRRT